MIIKFLIFSPLQSLCSFLPEASLMLSDELNFSYAVHQAMGDFGVPYYMTIHECIPYTYEYS